MKFVTDIVARVLYWLNSLHTPGRVAVFFAAFFGCFALAFLSEYILFRILGDNAIVPVLILIFFFVILTSYVFLRGGTWAGALSPPAGLHTVDAETLRERLLAINDLNLPFYIGKGKNGQLVAEWQIANDRWAGILEQNGLQMQHTITMQLDAVNNKVKVIEEDKTISWSAGIGRLNWSFSYFRGIDFFQYERGAEIGLIYKDGSWGIKPAYNYRFSLAEMKNPIIECILHSGWSFCPVFFLSGPLS